LIRLLLSGGHVVDGTAERPPYRADVLVQGDRVEQIIEHGQPEDGTSQAADGVTVLDCSGAFVSPGFIDIHTHSDLTWLSYPECTSRVTQGITTEVAGNCGLSPAPLDPADVNFRKTISVIDENPDLPFDWATFDQYLEVMSRHKAATNIVPLVGHGSIRQTTLARSGGDPGSALDAGGVDEIARLVGDALQRGAWGLSLGLMYSPGEAASTSELLAAAVEVQRHDAVLSVHMRDYEAAKVEEAITEMVQIHHRSGVNLELSHLRVLRANDLDVAERCLGLLEAAGEGVHADAYPYIAGQTTLFQLLAPADRRRGVAAMLNELPERGRHYARSISSGGFSPADVLVV
jgi:N-acyl-D-amino-acid deacylase